MKNNTLFYLYIVENSHKEAEQYSKHRKTYSKYLQNVTKDINVAIKAGNIDKIFNIEGMAQEFDLNFVKLNKNEKAIEKQKKAIVDLGSMKKAWEDGLDPEKVKEIFSESIKKIGDKKPIVDRTMDSLIKLQRRNLGIFASGKTTNAEENFYYSRQKALSLINKEHQKNINKALGLDMAQKQSLSR